MQAFTQLWESLNGLLSLSVGVLSTLLLIVVVVVIHGIAARAIRRNEALASEVRRRWLVQVRNGAILLLFLGLVVIWAAELRLMAVSLFAVAVATVIATKELIQCFSGSLLKTVSRGFCLGDRIEINGLRGDVNSGSGRVLHTGRAVKTDFRSPQPLCAPVMCWRRFAMRMSPVSLTAITRDDGVTNCVCYCLRRSIALRFPSPYPSWWPGFIAHLRCFVRPTGESGDVIAGPLFSTGYPV